MICCLCNCHEESSCVPIWHFSSELQQRPRTAICTYVSSECPVRDRQMRFRHMQVRFCCMKSKNHKSTSSDWIEHNIRILYRNYYPNFLFSYRIPDKCSTTKTTASRPTSTEAAEAAAEGATWSAVPPPAPAPPPPPSPARPRRR